MTLPDPQELRLVERADVYKHGALAATLTRTPDGVEFRYLPEWVRDRRPPVATTLPVNTGAIVRSGGGLPAYFSGLLPEGRRLGALIREVKTSADDELSLVLAVGTDTVGDVQVLPEGVDPDAVPPRLNVEDFSQIRFADLLAELGVRAQRVGLPGVQDKVSTAMLNLPVARAGDRFILKLNPPEYRHLVENEAFFLMAARKSGIEVADARVVTDADSASGLLVRRFDRIAIDGRLVGLAVEDACQVAGRPPADKYIIATDSAFGGLERVCEARLVAGRALLTQLVFAYLTGNGDAHAKNFSVLQGLDGEWRVAPAYDLPSSQPYGDTTMAMPIGGRITGDLGGSDFVALAAAIGVPERAAHRVVRDLVGRADRWLGDLELLPFDVARVRKLRRMIEYRRKRLTQ